MMQVNSPIGASSNHMVNKNATLLHCALKAPVRQRDGREEREGGKALMRVSKFETNAKRDRWTNEEASELTRYERDKKRVSESAREASREITRKKKSIHRT